MKPELMAIPRFFIPVKDDEGNWQWIVDKEE